MEAPLHGTNAGWNWLYDCCEKEFSEVLNHASVV